MAAGDAMFVGWKGSPLTKELPPRIGYVPSYSSDGLRATTLRKQLTRRIMCLDGDKETVIQRLQAIAELSLPVVSSAGAETTASFGGGWRLLTVADAQLSIGFTMLSVTYEKDVATLFEFDMPENVTITCAAGVVSIKYKTTELERLDSQTGSCTSGLEILCSVDGRVNPSPEQAAVALNNGRAVAFTFYANGVAFDTTELTAASCRNTRSGVYQTLRAAGPYTYEPDAAEIERVRTAIGASAIRLEKEFVRRPIAQVLTDGPTKTVTDGTITTITQAGPVTGGRFVPYDIQPAWFMYADFRRSFVYSGGPYSVDLAPRWEVSGSIIRIRVENLVLREWDVSGL